MVNEHFQNFSIGYFGVTDPSRVFHNRFYLIIEFFNQEEKLTHDFADTFLYRGHSKY